MWLTHTSHIFQSGMAFTLVSHKARNHQNLPNFALTWELASPNTKSRHRTTSSRWYVSAALPMLIQALDETTIVFHEARERLPAHDDSLGGRTCSGAGGANGTIHDHDVAYRGGHCRRCC